MKKDRIFVLACVVLSTALMNPAFSQDEGETQQWLEDLSQEVEGLKRQIGETSPGTTKSLVTGYATVSYTDRDGEDSTFGTDFNPIILWQLGDKLLFEGELAFRLEDGATETELEYSQITYLANDYLTLGAGKFLAPFNIFSERLHPSWINKLPDAPLAFSHGTGIAPPSLLGAQARGGRAFGASKINYVAYVANGPTLSGGDEHGAPADDGHGSVEVGALEFDNTDNVGDNMAYGGRFGFLPVPELELGYSLYSSDVDGEAGIESDVLLQGVDVSYIRDSDLLRGRLDIRCEWIWSDAGDVGFEGEEEEAGGDEHGSEEEEEAHELVLFENQRSGGYVQAAYQPTKVGNSVLRNLEFVGRYDMIDLPDGSPIDIDVERVTIGVNYWFGPSAVLKTAYQFDDKSNTDAQNQDAILIQAALGF